MTQQQRKAITDMLRASLLDPGGDLREQRAGAFLRQHVGTAAAGTPGRRE